MSTIYGSPLFLSGNGGKNETLPPLLDNFKAQRVEGGIVPPTKNTLAFKDVPDGAKIKLVQGSKIGGTVTYGTTDDLNHRIVFDSNDWDRKEFTLENDIDVNNISDSDINQWLNSTKSSSWWTKKGFNFTEPDYAPEQGFLYQLGITDDILAQNFNDIEINKTQKAKVGIPWGLTYSDSPKYSFFKITDIEFGNYGFLWGDNANLVITYNLNQSRVPSSLPIYNTSIRIHPMMEPKPGTKVALDSDGTYYMFENQSGGIILSADKMQESRETDLAGAVWVYGDHLPKNVNDGTKIELAKEDLIQPQTVLFKDIPSGKSVLLGKYKGQPIRWNVTTLSEVYSSTLADLSQNVLRIFDKNLISKRYFDSLFRLSERAGEITDNIRPKNQYETSALGKWLNSDDKTAKYYDENGFLSEWTEEEKSLFDTKQKLGVFLEVYLPNKVVEGSQYGFDAEVPYEEQDLFWQSEDSRDISSQQSYIYGDYQNITQMGLMMDEIAGAEPIICIKDDALFVFNGTDYVFESSASGQVVSTVQWDKSKDFYARQFTYNPKKQYQTMLDGAIAFVQRPTMKVSSLEVGSKSVLKLGKYNGKDLRWTLRGNLNEELFLFFDKNNYAPNHGFFFSGIVWDNKESQSNSKECDYAYSNVHQWLNSDKAANAWFTPTHDGDTPPDYANQNGFLYEWSEQEKNVAKTYQYSYQHNIGENLTVSAKLALPSLKETDLEGGVVLDESLNLGYLAYGLYWWLRDKNDSAVDYDIICRVNTSGSLQKVLPTEESAVFPLLHISPDTLVYQDPDENGVYSFCFENPDDYESVGGKIFEYSETAPSNKNLLWIQKGTNVLYVHNGTDWIAMTGVYGGKA